MARKRLTDEGRAERLEHAHIQLREGVAALTSSEAWLAYLQAMRRFHTYSAGNVMLILAQRPDATRVAGFDTWRSFGRHVKKGKGSGIAIFAPLVRKVEDKDETTDEVTTVRAISGFRIVYVYDVSDTEGEELPGAAVRPVLVEGEAPEGMWDYLAERIADAGFSLGLADDLDGHPGANGITDFATHTVTIATAGRSPASQCRTLAHELAHVCLHADHTTPRHVAEVEAESVAFLVADAWGLDGSAYTVPYIANWGATEPDAVLATAERVMKTAKAILGKADADRTSGQEVAA
jgi:hypothetical protein